MLFRATPSGTGSCPSPFSARGACECLSQCVLALSTCRASLSLSCSAHAFVQAWMDLYKPDDDQACGGAPLPGLSNLDKI